MYKTEQTELVLQKLMLTDIIYIQKLQLRGVEPEWFSEESYRYLVGFIYNHFNDYHAIANLDIITNKLNSVGANQFIINTFITLYNQIMSEITDIDNAKDNFEFYYKLFKDEKIKRDFNLVMQNSIDAIKEKDYTKAIASVEKGLVKIRALDKTDSKGMTIGEVSEERCAKYIDRKNNPDRYIGMPCGLREIDKAMNGFRSPDLCVIVARSGVGKSIALSVVARNMFKNGYNVIYGSIEISEEMSLLRLESGFMDLPFDFIRDGKLTDPEYAYFNNEYNAIKAKENDFYLMPRDKCGTPDGIRAEIEYYKNTYNKKPHAVFVDYINIMTLNTRHGSGLKDHEARRIIVEELKSICSEYDVNIWTAAQQTRDSKKAQVNNKDYDAGTEAISGSDFIGNTADFITFMEETKDDVEQGTLSVNNVKVRFGGARKFKLRKNWKRMYLGDMDEEEFVIA